MSGSRSLFDPQRFVELLAMAAGAEPVAILRIGGLPDSTGRTLELDNWALARRGLTAGRQLTARYGFEHARARFLSNEDNTRCMPAVVAAATASRGRQSRPTARGQPGHPWF